MIQTSTRSINTFNYTARHARIIDRIQAGSEHIFVYEFTLNFSAAAVVQYNLTKVILKVLPVVPDKDSVLSNAFSADQMSKIGQLKIVSGKRIEHLDVANKSGSPNPRGAGGLTTGMKNRLTAQNGSSLGFGGNFEISISGLQDSKMNSSEYALARIINFERVYRDVLISEGVRQQLFLSIKQTILSVPLLGFMSTRATEIHHQIAAGNANKIASQNRKQGLFAAKRNRNVREYYTGAPTIKYTKAYNKNKRDFQGGPILTSNIDTFSDNYSGQRSPPSQDFVRGPGNRPTPSSHKKNNRSLGKVYGITSFARKNLAQGTNAMLRDRSSASMTLIFEHGIAPTMLTTVDPSNSIVSIMQNYQGTSNLKNNGS